MSYDILQNEYKTYGYLKSKEIEYTKQSVDMIKDGNMMAKAKTITSSIVH